MEQKPRVGIGVLVMRDDQVLLGKRKGSHGEGEYAFPGGHLDYMESFADCARREVLEETGIEIDMINFLLLANITHYAPKHYVHLTVTAKWSGGEPKLLEPEKCEGWAWYDLDNLPSPLFEFCQISFEALKTGANYYDTRQSGATHDS